MKELEGLNRNLNNKRIELHVDLTLEDNSIFFNAEDNLHDLLLYQVNRIWMDFDAIPNMYEEVMINFQDMTLHCQIVQKTYHVQDNTLHIEINLKLQE